MKRSSKNYLNITTGLLFLYFLVLTVFAAVETRTDLERMNPGSPDSASFLSGGWYLLIAVLGAGLAACIFWAIVSHGNKERAADVFHHKLASLFLVLGTLAGGGAALFFAGSMIGTMPELRIELPAQSAPLAQASEQTDSQSSESVYQAPVPDLPPIKPVQNRIDQAAGVQTITDLQTVTGTIQAAQPDQSCILAKDQSALTLDQAVLVKSGDAADPDNALRFGLNAALLAAPGATVNVLGSSIESNAIGAGAAAVNGLNASITLNSSDLATLQASSPVVYAGFQGQMKVTAGTQISRGDQSPVFVSRASSAMQADSVTAQSYGTLSPIIRASGAFTGSSLNANASVSNFAQIEPGGEVNLTGSSFSAGAVQSDTGYQAMFIFDNQDSTGKQEPGRLGLNSCEWLVNPSSPAAASAWNFYVDQCSAVINLTNNTILQVPQAAKVTGGSLALNLQAQTLSGPVVGDADSSIDMTMIEGSRFTGTVNADNACPNAGLHLDASSFVSLTGDLYLTDFSNDDASNSNIQTNGFHIYLNGEVLL